MKELKNIPADIEWQLDEILQKVDDYVAECSMVGHSKSTGKSYHGYADVMTPVGCPTWDKVEDIEEVYEGKENSNGDEG